MCAQLSIEAQLLLLQRHEKTKQTLQNYDVGCVCGGWIPFVVQLCQNCARIMPDMDWGPMGDHFAFFNKIRIISFPVKPRKEKEKLCQKYKYIYHV